VHPPEQNPYLPSGYHCRLLQKLLKSSISSTVGDDQGSMEIQSQDTQHGFGIHNVVPAVLACHINVKITFGRGVHEISDLRFCTDAYLSVCSHRFPPFPQIVGMPPSHSEKRQLRAPAVCTAMPEFTGRPHIANDFKNHSLQNRFYNDASTAPSFASITLTKIFGRVRQRSDKVLKLFCDFVCLF
jgi:hypothetical protein